MISWLVIGILVVIAFFILKANHFRHRFWILFLIFMAVFLYISISVVNSKYDLDLTTFQGVSNSVSVYLGWLGNGFDNMKVLTGNAIKMDWTSSNESDRNILDKTNSSLKKDFNLKLK